MAKYKELHSGTIVDAVQWFIGKEMPQSEHWSIEHSEGWWYYLKRPHGPIALIVEGTWVIIYPDNRVGLCYDSELRKIYEPIDPHPDQVCSEEMKLKLQEEAMKNGPPAPPERIAEYIDCLLLHKKNPWVTGKKVWNEHTQSWEWEIIWRCDHGCVRDPCEDLKRQSVSNLVDDPARPIRVVDD